VLGFVLARALYDRYPDFTEGQLSKIRAHVVSRRSCAIVAAEIGLDRLLEESGEIPDDLRRSTNVLAALMEAVLAGLYLERGLDEIADAIVAAFESQIEEALHEPVDHKTTLQEELANAASGSVRHAHDGRAAARPDVHVRGARGRQQVGRGWGRQRRTPSRKLRARRSSGSVSSRPDRTPSRQGTRRASPRAPSA
jgi:ribonuclease-3